METLAIKRFNNLTFQHLIIKVIVLGIISVFSLVFPLVLLNVKTLVQLKKRKDKITERLEYS